VTGKAKTYSYTTIACCLRLKLHLSDLLYNMLHLHSKSTTNWKLQNKIHSKLKAYNKSTASWCIQILWSITYTCTYIEYLLYLVSLW